MDDGSNHIFPVPTLELRDKGLLTGAHGGHSLVRYLQIYIHIYDSKPI